MGPPDPDLLLILMFAGTMALGFPLVRAIARRISGEGKAPPAPLPPDVIARLERLEQIAEATQIEVERISEGQRFTTKLLAERVPATLHAPAPSAGSANANAGAGVEPVGVPRR